MAPDRDQGGAMTMDRATDLNCDLGEGEPWEKTRALLAAVTSANIACGGHAGDASSMRAIVRECRGHGTRIGAHPGHTGAFGRVPVAITAEGLERLLEVQVGTLRGIAGEEGTGLSHVKLHGALYHQADAVRALGEATLRFVARSVPGAVVYAPPAGWMARLGPDLGVDVWSEGFLDRGYRDDGTLVPRSEAGALVAGVPAVRERVREWLETGEVRAVSGRRLRLPARTWCVHGDTPEAVAMLAAAREMFDGGA